jgi:hypothetical protein
VSGPTFFEAWIAWDNWTLAIGVSRQRVGRWSLPCFWLGVGPVNLVMNFGGLVAND